MSTERARIHELVRASRRSPILRHIREWLPVAMAIIGFIVFMAGAEATGYKRGYFAGVHDGITLRVAATGGEPT